MAVPDLRRVAVLVVNYGSSGLVERNLVPLTREHPELSVFVLDNRSTDSERDAVTALASREGWEAIPLDRNVGFGEGMNLAAAAALRSGATRLLLLNPDASITGEAVESMCRVVDEDPMTMVAPRIVRPDGSVWFAGSDLGLRDGRVASRSKRSVGGSLVEWLTGAVLLISSDLWLKVGGFDPAYFLYWEDVDLSWRVQRGGGRLRVLSEVTAVHAPGGTQGVPDRGQGTAKSSVYYYFNIRNRLVFAALNLTGPEQRSWFRHTLPVSREILLRGGRRQLLRSFAPLRAALLGLSDGVKLARGIRAARRRGEPLVSYREVESRSASQRARLRDPSVVAGQLMSARRGRRS